MRVGVPHLVVPVDDLEADAGHRAGAGCSASTRCLPPRAPTSISSGWTAPKTLRIRTYERGVEDETLACGTGAVASALIAARLGQVVSPVTVHTRGGEALTVYFTPQGEAFTEVYLEGDALVVYQGELWVDELK